MTSPRRARPAPQRWAARPGDPPAMGGGVDYIRRHSRRVPGRERLLLPGRIVQKGPGPSVGILQVSGVVGVSPLRCLSC